VQVASGLRKLPDLTNATAVAQVAYLALNATNPETREAFESIIKGGTANPSDFSYSIPQYNTELQILYWLAEKRQLRQDDTLALAIAMVDGFWVTMGDDGVREAVRGDASNLLTFFRETSNLQRNFGYFDLETYPLEEKLSLAWTGGDPARGGRASYKLMSGGPQSDRTLNTHHFLEYAYYPMDVQGYRWNTVSFSTLMNMRKTVSDQGWIVRNVDSTVSNIEEYFYFQKDRHWIFTQPDDRMIEFNGEQTIDHNMNNPNLVFDYYLKTSKGLGVCGDEASLVESLLKSWGISAIRLTRTFGTKDGSNHDHVIYYDPATRTWTGYYKQLSVGRSGTWNVYLFKPPVITRNFYISHSDSQQSWMKMTNLYYAMPSSPGEQVATLFLNGVPTSQMKQWLLYS